MERRALTVAHECLAGAPVAEAARDVPAPREHDGVALRDERDVDLTLDRPGRARADLARRHVRGAGERAAPGGEAPGKLASVRNRGVAVRRHRHRARRVSARVRTGRLLAAVARIDALPGRILRRVVRAEVVVGVQVSLDRVVADPQRVGAPLRQVGDLGAEGDEISTLVQRLVLVEVAVDRRGAGAIGDAALSVRALVDRGADASIRGLGAGRYHDRSHREGEHGEAAKRSTRISRQLAASRNHAPPSSTELYPATVSGGTETHPGLATALLAELAVCRTHSGRPCSVAT